MFKRRIQKTLGDKILGFFWPTIGWQRAWAYIMLRLARLPGSAYSIAGGFACGAAMSFTPFVGLHFVLSAILAWSIRANIIASVIGTTVGNLGFEEVKFPKPVFAGDTIRAETTVMSKRESKSRPDTGIVTFLHEAINQRGEVVCRCERSALLKKKPN